MFRLLSNEQISQAAANLIAADITVRGHIHSQQDLFVAGRVEGNVHCAQTVYISAQAHISGRIDCQHLVIYGSATADIYSQSVAFVADTARVGALLRCGKLILHPQAQLPNGCQLLP